MKKFFQYKRTINFILRLLLIFGIAYGYHSLSNSSYSILTIYFISFGFIPFFYGCLGIDIITLKTEKAGWKYMLITSSIFSFIYLLTIYGGLIVHLRLF